MGKMSLQAWYWLVAAGCAVGGICWGVEFEASSLSSGYPMQGLSAGMCVLSATFAFLADRARRDGQPPRAP